MTDQERNPGVSGSRQKDWMRQGTAEHEMLKAIPGIRKRTSEKPSQSLLDTVRNWGATVVRVVSGNEQVHLPPPPEPQIELEMKQATRGSDAEA
jgi:hypothetical protein